ncbi:MAG: ABC transporter permease subunit [Nitriliruptorales bacterium]|nr:ABC transporter permease subunit [Nitriliruptorales bacterium]
MLDNVFLKTLRDVRRGLVGWSIGIVVLVSAMAALWPSVRDMPDLEDFLAGYPEAMRDLFNIEAITTGAGYLNAELYSIMLPALFVIFAIGRGARFIAGEEETGTLETLLVTPVSRLWLLLQKAMALAVTTLALGLALFVATSFWNVAVDLGVGAAEIAAGSVAMTLLGLEHGWLALAIGAATGRRSAAVGVAATVAVSGYVLYVMAKFVESIEPWSPISPFHQAIESGPLGGGMQPIFAWMALAGIVFVGAAAPLFDRRDVAAH